MKTALIAIGLVTAGLCTAVAFANEPVENVSAYRHGNLARAQDLSRQAYDALTAAQTANEYDMGGHAAKAKELLREANDEIKLAAEAANRH